MKRLTILIFILACAGTVSAQNASKNARRLPDKNGVPSGACVSGPPFVDVQLDISTTPPTLHVCKAGSFTATAGGILDVDQTAWASWAPTWTNLTVGNGTVVAKYKQIGKTVYCRLSIVLGSTSSISGYVQFTLPVTSVSYPGAGGSGTSLGDAVMNDAGVGGYSGHVHWVSTTTVGVVALVASGTYLTYTGISATVPFTFGTSDEINVQFFYEAA